MADKLLPLGTLCAGFAAGHFATRALDEMNLPYNTLQLAEKGIRAGADTGLPLTTVKTFEPGNTKGAGVWECTPGGFPVVNRPSTETVLILKGKGTITNADGSKVELTPGTWHTLPTGWTGRWDIEETLRKLYVITR